MEPFKNCWRSLSRSTLLSLGIGCLCVVSFPQSTTAASLNVFPFGAAAFAGTMGPCAAADVSSLEGGPGFPSAATLVATPNCPPGYPAGTADVKAETGLANGLLYVDVTVNGSTSGRGDVLLGDTIRVTLPPGKKTATGYLVAVLSAAFNPQESPSTFGLFGLVATSETSTPQRTSIEADSPTTKKGCSPIVKVGHKCLEGGVPLTLRLPLDITSGVPIFITGEIETAANAGAIKQKTAEALISDPLLLELPAGATYTSASRVFLTHPETAAPEPGTPLLLLTGLMGLVGAFLRSSLKR